MNPLSVEIHGDEFRLHAERAAHWPRTSTLIVTDLHLGKAETFHQNGLWLPPQAQIEDLERLTKLLKETCAKRLLILGDLIHTKNGVTPELEARFAAWLKRHDIEIHVLLGNHDRHFAKTWPQAWGQVELSRRLEVDGFRFQHEAELEDSSHVDMGIPAPSLHESLNESLHESLQVPFTWLGHLHPMVRIHKGPDRLRLPCFYIREGCGFLPAFSSLAGGETIHAARGERVFATSLEDAWVGAIHERGTR